MQRGTYATRQVCNEAYLFSSEQVCKDTLSILNTEADISRKINFDELIKDVQLKNIGRIFFQM